MYAVVNQLNLSIPVDELRRGLEEEGAPFLASLPGFRDFYLVRLSENLCTVIIFWDSQENAENGARVFGPTWFAQNIAPYLASEQQRSTGPVVVQITCSP